MKAPRFILLDGLRGLAAIGVVLLHVAPFYRPFTGLYLLVDFFFVLSGFVLLPIMPKPEGPRPVEVRKFIWRRFLRFWPMVTAVVLFRLLVWAQWEYSGQPNPIAGRSAQIEHFPISFFAALLLLHVIYPLAYEWSGVLWSLSAEWWANLLAIPFVANRRRWMLPIGLALSYLVMMIGWGLNQQSNEGVRSLGRAMVGFFIGLLLRRWFDSRQNKFSPFWFGLSVMTVIAFFVLESQVKTGTFIVASPVFAFFVYQVATIKQARMNITFLKASSFLGAMSFGIYAWHPNLIMVLSTAGVDFMSRDAVSGSLLGLLTAVFVVVGLSIGASMLTRRFIELPLQQRFFQREKPSTPVQ